MTFTIETHQDRTFTDPLIEVVETIDRPQDEVFIPRVIITDDSGEYSYMLPPQDYVNGTWTDADVETAITNYFNSISND